MFAIPKTPWQALWRGLALADWLDAERARAWLRILAVVMLALSLAWLAGASGGIDATGKAIGTDFASFYAASRLALDGQIAAIYDSAAHHAAQTAIFARDIGYAAFFYPPIYLLICLPMALVPYLASLAIWQAATLAFYWRVARRFGGDCLGALPFFAFPAVMLNIGHGQNAFLSAGLFGAGILAMERRPWLAGVMFGCLAYKPHLGVVIPLALAVAGQWRAFAGAAVTVVALVAGSALLFGLEAWRGFLAISPLAAATLEEGLVGAHKMQSVYAAVRVLGGGSMLAHGAQLVVALGVLVALALAIRQRPSLLAMGCLMVTASLLTSPFLLDYDLVLLALPLAWLCREGLRDGFQPFEKIVLLAGFVLPLLSRALAEFAHLPLGPAVIMAVFVMGLGRARIGSRKV